MIVLVGLPSLLVTLLWLDVVPAHSRTRTSPSASLPSASVMTTLLALKVLNNLARLDLPLLQVSLCTWVACAPGVCRASTFLLSWHFL
jgi:hypothetical protein